MREYPEIYTLKVHAAAHTLLEDSDSAVDESAGADDPMALHLSGEAVRFRDLIGGRSYSTISELTVDAPMGDEQAGLELLQQRAAELHADLIVGVRFEHGSGDDPTHVSGTAVRFN